MLSDQPDGSKQGRGQRKKRASEKLRKAREDEGYFLTHGGSSSSSLTTAPLNLHRPQVQPHQQPRSTNTAGKPIPTGGRTTLWRHWDERRRIPRFSADDFAIFHGKDGEDALLEDGADESWEDFAGNPDLYDKPYGLEYAVARTFVARARRALRAGRSWESFVSEEQSIDSEAHAFRESTDEHQRQLLFAECLDNDLRLAVFRRLQTRLHREVWQKKPDGISDRQDSKSLDDRQDSKSLEPDGIYDRQDSKPVEPDSEQSRTEGFRFG